MNKGSQPRQQEMARETASEEDVVMEEVETSGPPLIDIPNNGETNFSQATQSQLAPPTSQIPSKTMPTRPMLSSERVLIPERWPGFWGLVDTFYSELGLCGVYDNMCVL